MNLEQTERGEFLIYRNAKERRLYYNHFRTFNKDLWTVSARKADRFPSKEAAIDAMAQINERRRLRLRSKK